MATFPDNSIDFVWTDPPYGHHNNNGDLISRWESALGRGAYKPEENRPIANDGAEANEIYQDMLVEAVRILKPGSVICSCCGGGGGPNPQYARWSIWMDELFEFKQMVVWDKGKIGMGWHYRRSYEVVLVGVKKGKKGRWYDTSRKIENIIRHIPKIIPRKNQHPTVKPVALVEHFLSLHSQAGDIILDPFVGSGTTAIACLNTGRNYIGIEQSEEYCELARNRIADTESSIQAA
jgi:DNA modification methylase